MSEQPDQVPTLQLSDQPFRLPFADLLPDLTPDEFAELKADIQDRGIQVPIMLAVAGDDGETTTYDVIDGQHRLKAACELGITFDDLRWQLVTGTPEELAALAFDLNVKRRQLTKAQRNQSAVKLRQAGLSYRDIADRLKASHETIRRAVKASDATQPETITGKDGKTHKAIDDNAQIKRACRVVIDLLNAGATVSAAALESNRQFTQIGIPPRRAISVLVGDRKIKPAGNGSYCLVEPSTPTTQTDDPQPAAPADQVPTEADYSRIRAAIRHTLVDNAITRPDREFVDIDDLTIRLSDDYGYTADQLRQLCADLVQRGTLIETPDGWEPVPTIPPADDHQAGQDRAADADGQDLAPKRKTRLDVPLDEARQLAAATFPKSRVPLTAMNVSRWAGIGLEMSRAITAEMHAAGTLTTAKNDHLETVYHYPDVIAAYLVKQAGDLAAGIERSTNLSAVITAEYGALSADQLAAVRESLHESVTALQTMITTLQTVDSKIAHLTESESTEGATTA